MKTLYVITHVVSSQLGTRCNLERITESETEARALMDSVYEDAASEFVGRFDQKFHSPEWLNTAHNRLRIYSEMPGLKMEHIFCLSERHEDAIYGKESFILI